MQDKHTDLAALGNSEAPVRSRQLWRLRNTMQKIVSRHVLKDCGHVINRAVAVQRLSDSGAGAFGGLSSCSSVWCCPVCSAKISAYRNEQLAVMIDWAKRHHYVISMLTLTMRHDKSQDLKFLWESLSHAFARVQQSSGFKNFRKDVLIGYVKATEVTHGDNGWHVHNHVLMVQKRTFEGYQCNKRGDYIKDYIATVFERFLKKNNIGFLKSVGIDWQMCTDNTERILARYVGKIHGDIAKELTLGNFKTARGKTNRTPFQILADIQADNFSNKQDIALFREFEQASYHKLQLQYSRGLLKQMCLADLSDEEILDQNTERETLLFIPREDWSKLKDTGNAALILHAVNNGLTKDTLSALLHIPIFPLHKSRKPYHIQ